MNKQLLGEDKTFFKILLSGIYLILAAISYKIGFRAFSGQETPDQSLFVLQLGRTMGIFAISLLIISPILSLKSKILDRAFSLDKMYLYHKLTALLCLITATLHPLLINVSKLIPEPGPNESELPELLGVIGLIALWSLVCTSIFRKFLMLKYEAWRKIHLISAVLRYAAVIHVFLIQSESRAGGFLFFLASISAVSFALAIWDKLLAPFILKSDREYLLKSTKEVAPDVFELTLEPKVQKEVFQYSPGQFAYLKIKSNEFLFESHPFTIVSDSTETTHLKFNIKALGDWTKKLSSLPESIDSEIIGPFGKFSPFLFNNKTKSLVLIAGGIGITPFISLIRSLSSLKIKLPVLLLWSCKTPKDFFFKAELDEIKSSFPELEYRFYVSDAPSNGVFTNSRITLETLTHQLKPNVSGTQILVCGPPGMMSAVIKDLLSLGFKKNSIHFEDFSYLD